MQFEPRIAQKESGLWGAERAISLIFNDFQRGGRWHPACMHFARDAHATKL
ncbi:MULTISPECIES: hypothetical protein [Bradyrhizobium]|uniref:hypothetical protein n=1 Tax=Bradyrhizobium TaxID=374 RepID=UPI0004B903A3|nr:hypothetical protein [Bradyrhizobium elkanii]WLA80720.1 hypothetical protein QNJ99_35860 [Bradyrhizobium elkanii]